MAPEPERVANDLPADPERAADEAMARLAAIVESTDDAIISKDLEGRIQTWNAAAERLLGYRAEEVVGQQIYVIIPPDLRQEEVEILRRIRAGQRIDHFETRRVTRSGELIDVSITVSPVRNRHDRIIGASKILRDVTRQKQLDQALRDANARLLEVDRRKDEFLAMLSHELRNPLAPICNSLMVLERAEPGREQARRALEVVKRQVGHLTRIVDDLLDVTRVARGKIEIRRAELDLAELTLRTAEDHRGFLQSHGIDLVVEAPRRPIPIQGDGVRLAQVLGNLLRNAAKFSDVGGHVTLSVGIDDGGAVIRVRDDGSGIDPALLDRIFEPFIQEKQSLARSRGGLGLGLALVKGLVELHGGSVGARSEGPGNGSEFTIRLPLRPGSPLPSPDRPARATAHGAGQLRVLVVDDNRDSAETLAELLQLLGHEVEVAFDGQSAVERAGARRADVVLCDIGLPGMSGYEVAQALQGQGVDGTLLVAISGYAQAEDVRRAHEAGFHVHLAKPLDFRRLEELFAGRARARG